MIFYIFCGDDVLFGNTKTNYLPVKNDGIVMGNKEYKVTERIFLCEDKTIHVKTEVIA